MSLPEEKPTAPVEPWRAYLAAQRPRFLAEAQELLRIPSVSTLPEHKGDVAQAAQWVAARAKAAGLRQVEIFETGGHPIVLAGWGDAPGKPTVLVYGHFDTQPTDPVDDWLTPPFEPSIRSGRIYARGASDDKGNMLAPIFAIEALLATAGALPVNVRLLFEGEEEIGSPSLAAFVAAHREALACDAVLSADGSQYSEEQPQLIMSCRGLCGLEVTLRGAASDLHSGLYGGAVQNPLTALARLLASLHDEDGSIAVAGFYDDVRTPSDEERRLLARVPFEQRLAELGLAAQLSGEDGYTALERVGVRPTLELNGVGGGFQGEGLKTVIPAVAHAKLSCRLVPEQAPARIFDLVASHLERHCPPGVELETRPLGPGAKPYRTPIDDPVVAAASSVLSELYGREPFRVYAGASLPICETFLSELGAHTTFFAFALDDENVHAPNEFLRIASFERAQVAYCALFERLGRDL